jgi:hypothetical protein
MRGIPNRRFTRVLRPPSRGPILLAVAPRVNGRAGAPSRGALAGSAHRVDHDPPRTARAKRLLNVLKDAIEVPLSKLTSHANEGSPAADDEDQ